MKPYFFGLIVMLFGCSKADKLFEKLSPEYTGVGFVNNIIENDSINILTFEYTYNGDGVALADFNNDGIQDLFFSANMSGNKLYLGSGEMKYVDISKSAGIGGEGKWCTAAIAVDINYDGWMDIYIPASSTPQASAASRQNLLYINQKGQNPTFKEMGLEYGVADDGFSEGAAFFDYDNDGDLDLYVLTNIIDQNPNLFRQKITDGSNPNTDRLYRNDWNETLGHPVYTNVSKETGILIEGFGLGVNITDINHDGWKDIFVTNDYASDDLLYINNQNGTFTNRAKEYFKHSGYSSMGNDVADINNDGHQDLFVLDMMPQDNLRKKMFVSSTNPDWFRRSDEFGYTYQYMRNTLQLNTGEAKDFQEIGLLAGVAETDWSWTPSLADFDNDGFVDLLITNGFPKDITDKDFMKYRAEAQHLVSKERLLKQIPEVKIANYAYRNKGDLTFSNETINWGMDTPSFSSGATFGDLDDDGDLDYVVNNTSDPAFIYRNSLNTIEKTNGNFLKITFQGDTKNPNGIGAVVIGTRNSENDFYAEMNPYRGYKSTISTEMHIGLGSAKQMQQLTVIWPNGKAQTLKNVQANQRMKLKIEEAQESFDWKRLKPQSKPIFTDASDRLVHKHEEIPFFDFGIQSSMPFSLADLGPGAAVADVNGDGLDDLFIGGPKFESGVFFIQNIAGSFIKKDLLPALDSTKKLSEDTGVLLFDADSDGDNDLYIVSGGNENYGGEASFEDHLYTNDGKGNFAEAIAALPIFYGSGSCVRAADYDLDGDLDLFIAGRNLPSQYPKPASSTILRNDSKAGKPKFSNITEKVGSELKDCGSISDALWTDFDNDKDPDLILAGDFMAITVFENTNGQLKKLTNTGLEDYLGLWNSISSGDYDQDGDIDYVVGNAGQNGLFKGTQQNPALILSGDFDGNGNYELLPFIHFPDGKGNGVLAPYNGKDDISLQYNALRTRFTTYKEYANARADNLLNEAENRLAIKHYLNYCSSVILENKGKGRFAMRALPIEAQYSPVDGILSDDFNADGHLDLLMVGNRFNNELLVGKMDASNGLLLVGNGKGGFSQRKHSGFHVPGNARSLVSLFNAQGEKMLLALQNRSSASLFRLQKTEGRLINLPLKARRYAYEINGRKILLETNFGSSYLSQSSRKIVVPTAAKAFKIIQ